MTDKEKIIIDGVDVSECFKYTKGFEEFDCGENYSKFHYRFCSENPNCFYKQLKRKEQECEELIKEKAEIKKYLGISDKTIIQRLEELQEFKDKLKISEYNYKQALDEIAYQVTELFLGVENKDRAYCEKILSIINKAKDGK